MHFVTVSLQNNMPWWITSLEIAMFFFLNPFAPGCCCFLWMIFRIQGNQKLRLHYSFLSKLTCLINASFESPIQIVLLLFFFVTGRIQPPWLDTTVLTDSLGNEISLGSYLSIVSFCLGWLSLIKNVNDSYQCNQACDILSVIAFIIPNILCRTFCFTFLVTVIREWIMILVAILILINFSIGLFLKPKEKGINQASTMFCSIFSVVGLPNDPTIKETTGKGEVDPNMLKKITLLITIVSTPVISGFCWGAYALSHEMGFNIDINILLSHEQQLFIIQILLSAFTGLSFLSCIIFAATFNNNQVCNIVKGFLNGLMLSLVACTLIFAYLYFPAGLHSFVAPIHQVHGGVKIFEGLSSHVFTNSSVCRIHNRTSIQCGQNQTFNVKFVPNILSVRSFDENTLLFLDKRVDTTVNSLFVLDTFKIIPPQMNTVLKKEIENANCLLCNNPESNRCRNMLYGQTICKSSCESTPNFIGAFTVDSARWLLKGETPGKVNDKWSFDNKKVDVEDRNMHVKEIELHCKSPKYFFNLGMAKKCQTNESRTECRFGEVKCFGDGKWSLEPEELECREPRDEQECQDNSGYFSEGVCMERPRSDRECRASGRGEIYGGQSQCYKADGEE